MIVDRDRCTTRKLRVVTTRNQQVARIDYECDRPASGELEAALARKVKDAAAHADVVLLSDYQKGAITHDTAQAAIGAAKARGVPVLVDPKVPHIDHYAGASLISRITTRRKRSRCSGSAPRRKRARPRSDSASARGARAC